MGNEEFFVPGVVAQDVPGDGQRMGRRVPLSTAADLPEDERNAVALKYVRFLFAGPSLAGLLHADPHPGNFKIMPDGRLGIVDLGLVARLPEGLPGRDGADPADRAERQRP